MPISYRPNMPLLFTSPSGLNHLRAFVVLLGVLLMSWASPEAVWTQAAESQADRFFKSLMLGGAVKGTIYLELNLKEVFFARAKSDEERRDVWSTFLRRAAKDSSDYFQASSVPYWGDAVYKNLDVEYVASAVELQIGERVKVHTSVGLGAATITGYAIHHYGGSEDDLLLAVARPAADFKVADTRLLIAARELPECKGDCANKKMRPRRQTLDKIRAAVLKGVAVQGKHRNDELIALEGHFTRRDSIQYAVYATYLASPDPLDPNARLDSPFYSELRSRHWITTVLDSDFSIVAVLGEDDYAHIKPRSVGDLNGDGLDEIWAALEGHEGSHSGIAYWRGGEGEKAFGWIATTYFGL